MTPGELEVLAELGGRLSRSVEIVAPRGADARGAELRRFCEELGRHVPRLKVRTASADDDRTPAIRIGRSIRYRAVPLGAELAPFLDALAWHDHGPPPLNADVQRHLDTLPAPASLEVFIAPGCPHCPATVRTLLPLAAAERGIALTVIDGSMFGEAAEAAGIRSVPTVILDGEYRWIGAVRVEEVAEMAAGRDPARLGADALMGLIEDGRAPRLAEMMETAGVIFPAFIELLAHEKWPVRLGAMVAFEYLAESSPNLAAAVADALWQRFDGADDTAKGDILHVIGQTGNRAWLPRLRAIACDSGSEELRAAAAEALDMLCSKDG